MWVDGAAGYSSYPATPRVAGCGSAAVVAAVDQLAAALDALPAQASLQLAQATIGAGRYPRDRSLWRAMHHLALGATRPRLERLVNLLEVLGPASRAAIRQTARQAVTGDEPRTAVWAALVQLVDATGGGTDA